MIDLAPASTDPAVTDQPVGKRRWRRMGFRAGTIYLGLYNFDSLTRLLPGFKWADELWTNAWLAIGPWVGKHVLGISYSFSGVANGSGDKTFNYVQLFCYVVLALVGGLIWSGFDRAGRRDPLIHDLLRVSVRYVLAASMFVYGLSKIFHLQMPDPGPGRLMEPYGGPPGSACIPNAPRLPSKSSLSGGCCIRHSALCLIATSRLRKNRSSLASTKWSRSLATVRTSRC